MTTADQQERPAAQYDGRTLRVRASAAGECPRRLYLLALGEAEPAPTAAAARCMAMGRLLEPLARESLAADGWEVRQAAGLLRRSYGPLVIEGTPDGVCRHSEHTDGEWAVLEIKARGGPMYRYWQAQLTAAATPGALRQLAAYSALLEPRAGALLPGVMAALDRDSGALEWEYIPAKTLAKAHDRTLAALQPLPSSLADGDRRSVSPPYAAESAVCQVCPMRLPCGNAAHGLMAVDAAPTDYEARDLLEVYQSPATKKVAGQRLLAWLDAQGAERATLTDWTGQAWDLQAVGRTEYRIDRKMLRGLLDDADWQRVTEPEKSRHIRLRRSKNGS